MTDKQADLAGPGIGSYEEVAEILPSDYSSTLTPRETQQAIFVAKEYIEANLCRELNLIPVTVPLIVDVESGVNDFLDRGRRFSFTSPTMMTSTQSTHKSYRPPPSGNAWHSRNSLWMLAKVC